jgi:hypothetical protein
MAALRIRRSLKDFMGMCIAVVTLFLFPGCNTIQSFIGGDTEEEHQPPTILLLTREGDANQYPFHRIVKDASGNPVVEVDFNWQKWMIGGHPASEILKKMHAQEWRLTVYDYYTGKMLNGADSGWRDAGTQMDFHAKGFPLDQLITVVVDVKTGRAADPDPASFVLLFKRA